MAEVGEREVNARIVYWGAEGAGKSANLATIAARLRPDHRGPLRAVPTPLDPTVTYEVLPIELGEVSGVRTRLEAIAVPGAPELAPTRKHLLDQADGIVLVLDATRERLEANVAAFEELRSALGAYGRSLDEVPLVLQINKRDVADPFALEELHRKLEVPGAPAFEAVATEGTGVIPTLTTISKRVIRALRGPAPAAPAPSGAEAASGPAAPEAPAARAEAPAAAAAPWPPAPEPLPAGHGPTPAAAGPLVDTEAVVELEGTAAPHAPAPVDLEAAALVAGDADDGDAGRARELLAGGWDAAAREAAEAAAVEVDPMAGDAAGDAAWRLASAGPVRPGTAGGLEIPVELAGPDGARVRLRITLRLDGEPAA